MNKIIVNIITKTCILLAIIYLFISINKGDIEYIYANF
jgi:hypothetical protein